MPVFARQNAFEVVDDEAPPEKEENATASAEHEAGEAKAPTRKEKRRARDDDSTDSVAVLEEVPPPRLKKKRRASPQVPPPTSEPVGHPAKETEGHPSDQEETTGNLEKDKQDQPTDTPPLKKRRGRKQRDTPPLKKKRSGKKRGTPPLKKKRGGKKRGTSLPKERGGKSPAKRTRRARKQSAGSPATPAEAPAPELGEIELQHPPSPEVGEIETHHPEFHFEDNLRCGRCKGPVDPAKVQVVGKAAGSYRCNRCNSRAVQLSRLPQWQEFSKKLKTMPAEVKAEFWAQSHKCSGPGDLKEFLSEREILMERITETTNANKSGVYQPLSWYAKQGYDAASIEKYCVDKKEHPILGMTYRVVLEGASSSMVAEKVRETRLEKGHKSGMSGGGTTGAVDGAGQQGGANPEDPKRADDPEVKPKDPPKDAASLARERKKEQGLASRQMSRLALVLVPLQAILKHKKTSQIPEVALQGAKDVLAQLQAVESECKAALRGSSAGLTHSMADISDLVARPGGRPRVRSHMH